MTRNRKRKRKMETKDDDAIQMIEDSIEGIKGLDGYKEDEGVAVIPETVRQDVPVGERCYGNTSLVGGSNDVFVPIPMPIDPRPAQTDKSQRFIGSYERSYERYARGDGKTGTG